MKTFEVNLALLLLLVVVAALLFWTGGLYRQYSYTPASLDVSVAQPQNGGFGSPVIIELRGKGITSETVVSLVMDTSNEEMIVNRYPLEGFFNTSLSHQNLLLLGGKDGLDVLDTSDPESPRLLDRYLSGRSVLGMHFSDTHVFVNCGRLGIAVMEIVGNRLVHQTDIWVPEQLTFSLYHQGFLYIGARQRGLLVYDVRDPNNIVPYGHYPLTEFIRSIAAYGSRLYLSVRTNELIVIDINDPARPERIAAVPFADQTRDVLVHSENLYVSLRGSIWMLSLEDPSLPVVVDSWDGFASIVQLVRGQKNIYVLDSYSSFQILSIPGHELSGSFQFVAGVRTLAETSGYLYLTGGEDGLVTINHDKIRPRQLARYLSNTTGGISDALVTGNYFYLSGYTGLYVMDKSRHLDSPVLVDSSRSLSLVHDGNLLFVSQSRDLQAPLPERLLSRGAHEGVKVFDISDPVRPSQLEHWQHIHGNKLMMMRNFLIAAGVLGFSVVDIADVRTPRVTDSVFEDQVLAMDVEENFLYILTRSSGLKIYHLQEDGILELMSTIESPFPMNVFTEQTDIRVKDRLLYIANGRAGLLVMNAGNPQAPSLLANLALPGFSKGVQIHQDRAYVISQRDGISVVDISVPEKPMRIAHLPIGRITRYLLFAMSSSHFVKAGQFCWD